MSLSTPPTRLGIQRYIGPLRHQWQGSWTPLRVGAALIRCPDCNGADEIAADRIDASGEVTDEFLCQLAGCNFARLITLSGWGGQFDLTDVRS